jgi:hypothetical protein
MEALRVQKEITSETLYLHELKNFLGKKVEIILLELPSDEFSEEKADINNFISAAGMIDIDEGSVEQLRKESMI